MEFNSFFKTTTHRKYNTWCKYTTRLDTYGCGCSHDCKYCYARGLLNFRGNWGIPKTANLVKIKKRISKVALGSVVRMGGMTDCFQPLESAKQVTYNTIRMLNWYKIGYLIVTKSSLVSDDKYIAIYDKSLSHFQISITATNDKKCMEFEKASLVSDRIRSVEKLQMLGFDVSIRLSPFIPEYIDFDVLNSIKCSKILIEFLKVNHHIRSYFDIDYSDYTYKYGGYQNLALDRKIELVSKITGFDQVSVGEYVLPHYEYFRDYVNYNKQDCCNLTINLREKQNFEQLQLL